MSADVMMSQKPKIAIESKKTVCAYCGVGCGIIADISGDEVIDVKGDENHPSNFGRLCVKGSSLNETLGHHGRLTFPTIDGERASWQQANTHIAQRIRNSISEYGADSVAFYLSGQLLTEDYYVANKLMKGFIGSGNVDTNSRLCMASASTAYKRAFGEDLVPNCYEDFDSAEVIFFVGSNAAYAHPIVYQRVIAAQKNNPSLKLIVIDPRGTATSDTADIHLPIKAGSDSFFFNGLLHYMYHNNAIDREYIAQHCDGFEQVIEDVLAVSYSVDNVAFACDVDLKKLVECFELFSQNQKVITLFSQGINQSSSGVDKGNAIINCHLAGGKIGIAGAGPFSITGQPNAMGGREVGGLSTQLAAHMHYEQQGATEIVESFWQAPNIAKTQGLKAVDLFDAVDAGKIKVIWIMATNPVVSLPDADLVKRALEKCPTVIVSECFEGSDTLAYANVVLPTSTWGEKFGTVTNSERRVSFQAPLVKAPDEAKHDWQIVCDVADSLGFGEAFNYQHPVEIFREHAMLSGFRNDFYQNASQSEASPETELTSNSKESENGSYIKRVFDISGLADISKTEYETLKPIQWPVNKRYPDGLSRLFLKYQQPEFNFPTPNGKAQFISISAKYPKIESKSDQVILNTGRIRDQWHTMTRTGRAAKLANHFDEPFVFVNPKDARRFSLIDEQLARITNKGKELIVRVKESEQQRIGEVFTPIHWSDRTSSSARVSALVNAITDPLCGQPEFKHSPVKIAPLNEFWSGCLVSIKNVTLQSDYWTKITLDKGVKALLADTKSLSAGIGFMKSQYPEILDWVMLKENKQAPLRIAGFLNDTLICFFVTDTQLDKNYNTQFIEESLGKELSKSSRMALLSNPKAIGEEDVGATICTCYRVGEKTITAAIESGECNSVEALGKKLKCGTNCGSCIPELKKLLVTKQAKQIEVVN